MGHLQEFFRPKIFKYKYNKNSVIHGIPRLVFLHFRLAATAENLLLPPASTIFTGKYGTL